MKVVNIEIDKLIPYARNPRNNKDAIADVAASLREFGFRQPIVVDPDMSIVVGHTRWLAAKKLKLTEVPVHIATNLTEQQIKAYRLADNRVAENSEWDLDFLKLELEELGDEFTGFENDDFDELFGEEDANTYTKTIEPPVYTPKGDKPSLSELYDNEKAKQFEKRIEEAEVPDDIKVFLNAAAQRHVVFDYHQIAEYYCHAAPEVQDLMEQSALIIIDFDKALENGYLHYTDRMKKLVGIDKPTTSDDPVIGDE